MPTTRPEGTFNNQGCVRFIETKTQFQEGLLFVFEFSLQFLKSF